MKTARKIIIGVLSVILSGLAGWTVVNAFHEPYVAPVSPVLIEKVRTGDIIFTEGHSLKSDIVRLGGGRDTEISHTGFIQTRGDGLYVTHMSIDDDRIMSERIETFMERNVVQSYVIMRMDADKGKLGGILDSLVAAEVPFDNSYDIYDPSEYYCTELVCRVLESAGYDVGDVRMVNGVLYPSDLLRLEGLELIHREPGGK